MLILKSTNYYVIQEEVEPFQNVGVADSQTSDLRMRLFIHDSKQLVNKLLLGQFRSIEFINFGVKDFDTVGVGDEGVGHVGIATFIVSHSL